MIFKYSELYDHHYNQLQNFFITPPKNPCSLTVTLHFRSTSSALVTSLLSVQVRLVQTFHMNAYMWSFVIGLGNFFHLAVMILRFICAVEQLFLLLSSMPLFGYASLSILLLMHIWVGSSVQPFHAQIFVQLKQPQTGYSPN